MTIRRKTHIAIALLAIAGLILAACGSRIDQDTIARAAAGTGGTGGSAAGLSAQDGTLDAGPGEAAGTVGAGPGEAAGTGESSGPGTGPGKDGPGQTGKPGQPGGPSGRGAGGSGEPIVIGSVGTYSGAVGATFEQAPRALQAWAAAINTTGGISGRPVKVIVMDDRGSAATSRAQVRELVEKHKVAAIVSANVLTASLNAWKGYVNEKKVPVLGGVCGPGWHGPGILFTGCPSVDTWAFGVPFVGAKYGTGKKFGALLCREDALCDILEDRWFTKGYAKRAGLEPVYNARISITQPDFTSECVQAKNAGVEILFVLADPGGVARAAAACSRQNYQPQFLQVDATVNSGTPTKTGLQNVLQTSLFLPFAGVSSPAFREFDAAWKKYGGGQDAGAAAVRGWVSAKMFERAARKAGKNISRDAIIKAMYSFTNERFGGLTIPLSYGPQGTKDSPCVFPMKAANGRWTAPNSDKPACW